MKSHETDGRKEPVRQQDSRVHSIATCLSSDRFVVRVKRNQVEAASINSDRTNLMVFTDQFVQANVAVLVLIALDFVESNLETAGIFRCRADGVPFYCHYKIGQSYV